MKCSFCSRINDNAMAYLIAGPEGNNICDECLLKIAEGTMATDSSLKEAVVCSFCNIQDLKPHGIGDEGRVTICTLCTLNALRTISNQSKSYHDMAVLLGNHINTPGYYSAD